MALPAVELVTSSVLGRMLLPARSGFSWLCTAATGLACVGCNTSTKAVCEAGTPCSTACGCQAGGAEGMANSIAGMRSSLPAQWGLG